MKFLVFSDVHGNLPALESVLKTESNVDGYINIGDVVNYGPWSNECVELIASLENCYNIKGNHEVYFEKGICDVENKLVQDFFTITFKDFKHQKIINLYKDRIAFNEFDLIHTIGPKGYVFEDTEVHITKNTILGHSHQQFIRFVDGKYLVNPGSVGQNRKWINVSNYALWDTETNEFTLKQMTFDLEFLLNEMAVRNYPKNCIEYYKNKKRY